MSKNILKLYGKVQNYAWGGNDFIPQLIGLSKDNKPYAEYWMGAHASASSEVQTNDHKQNLRALIELDPQSYIGDQVFQKFGELPYLFKVLDVKDMLSIQVHPSKEEAVKGFEKEEHEGVPLNATHRNYKDKNHKPEVMVALSEFWLLHGFKSEELLNETLENIPELRFLQEIFSSDGYYGLYKKVMEMDQQQVDTLLLPLVQRELAKSDPNKNEPGFWVKKLYADHTDLKNLDRGVFSVYFFNIVHLHKGQAIFQAAGIPHAYLEGQNMELMANSDNVLRGGLTPKYIDVQELLKHVKFEATIPQILNGTNINETEKIFECPVPDFGISEIKLAKGSLFNSKTFSGEIFFIVKGSVTAASDTFKKGESFYALPDSDVSLTANDETLAYRAFVPAL